jgi:CAAX protease family protein
MSAERKAGLLLAAIVAVEGAWVLMNLYFSGWRFIRYLGFASGLTGHLAGWIAGSIIAVMFIVQSTRLPSVRQHLFHLSYLKLLALAVAITAGILEEVMFRRWTMNWLMTHGQGAVVQVLGAGLLFGLLHGIWGLIGKSMRAALGAIAVTGVLGALLGLAFLLAGRSLAPCVTAHFLINLFVEPGVVLAAIRGEMRGILQA